VVNPFDNPQLVARYEAWYAGSGRRADRLEKHLLGRLLGDFPRARSILEVGCGTGHFTRWMAQRGLAATGLDVSQAMLAEAARMGGPTYVAGDAGQLPFHDQSFDLVALITTLEFLPDPERALIEADRVARHGLLLGVLNRQSWLGRQRQRERQPPWDAANLFTVRELISLVRRATGAEARIHWRTTLWPLGFPGSLPLPWGGFIGMSVARRARPTNSRSSP
jgi:ubiquinone/menaquinone biosynthesis C-methylase UbiE